MAAKKSGKKIVKNVSEQAYALPDGTYLPVGESVVVSADVWEAAQDNETVSEWVGEGYFEVEDAPAEEEPKKPEPAPAAPAASPKKPER